jgi:hypothetical protein
MRFASRAQVQHPVESAREDTTYRCKISAGGWFWQGRVIPAIYKDSVAFPVLEDMGKCLGNVDFLRLNGHGFGMISERCPALRTGRDRKTLPWYEIQKKPSRRIWR